MRITIEKLDSGHLIEVETEDGIKKHSAGKWHAVCTVLREYLYKPENKEVKKKEVKKKKSNKRKL